MEDRDSEIPLTGELNASALSSDPLYERSGEKTTKHQLPQKITEFLDLSKLTENPSH